MISGTGKVKDNGNVFFRSLSQNKTVKDLLKLVHKVITKRQYRVFYDQHENESRLCSVHTVLIKYL